MPQVKYRKINPDTVVKLRELETSVKRGVRTMRGKNGTSSLDQPALSPGYEQAMHHLERALVWLEEMNYLIASEGL